MKAARTLGVAVLALSVIAGLSVPASLASSHVHASLFAKPRAAVSNTAVKYYGLLAKHGSTVIAELQCDYSGGGCTEVKANTVTRVTNSADGDLVRIKGKYRDRRKDSRPVYVNVLYLSDGSRCVENSFGIGVSAGPKAFQVALPYVRTGSTCKNWPTVKRNANKSSAHISAQDSTAYSKFTFKRGFDKDMGTLRSVITVCENNNLYFSDRCSGHRIIDVNV